MHNFAAKPLIEGLCLRNGFSLHNTADVERYDEHILKIGVVLAFLCCGHKQYLAFWQFNCCLVSGPRAMVLNVKDGSSSERSTTWILTGFDAIFFLPSCQYGGALNTQRHVADSILMSLFTPPLWMPLLSLVAHAKLCSCVLAH